MGGPEAVSEGSTTWLEGFGAFLLLLLTLGGQAWRYIKEGMKEETTPKHVVLETAELADMNPIRLAVQKLDRLFEMERDIDAMRQKTDEMHEILKRIDRADEVEREVQARLREEQRSRRD